MWLTLDTQVVKSLVLQDHCRMMGDGEGAAGVDCGGHLEIHNDI